MTLTLTAEDLLPIPPGGAYTLLADDGAATNAESTVHICKIRCFRDGVKYGRMLDVRSCHEDKVWALVAKAATEIATQAGVLVQYTVLPNGQNERESWSTAKPRQSGLLPTG